MGCRADSVDRVSRNVSRTVINDLKNRTNVIRTDYSRWVSQMVSDVLSHFDLCITQFVHEIGDAVFVVNCLCVNVEVRNRNLNRNLVKSGKL